MASASKPRRTIKKLTEKEEAFCYFWMEYRNYGEAYAKAFGEQLDRPKASQRGAELAKRPHIANRLREMQDELRSRELWAKSDSVDFLIKIAAGLVPDTKVSDRLNAIKELNTIHGFNNKLTIDNISSDNSRVEKISIEVIDGTQDKGDQASS